MRFVLAFKAGADVEFEIPEADLQRHPDTMLSVWTRPRWAGPEGAPEAQRIEAPETAEDSWSDGMDAFVVSWYARTGGQAIELLAPAELEDAVAIADWLLLPLGDLSEIVLGGDALRKNQPVRRVRRRREILIYAQATPRTATWRARCARRPTSSSERTAKRPWSRSRRPSTPSSTSGVMS
jgi:hypothetical protein